LSRRRFLGAGIASLSGVFVRGYAAASPQITANISATDLGGLTLFQGAGCNVVAMRGKDGALMIDGGLAANADALLKAVKERTGNTRIQMLINTHWHPEQTGANEAVGRDGGVIFAHEKTRMYLSNTVASVTFTGRRATLPEDDRRTRTTRSDGSMEMRGDQSDLGYRYGAHNAGDLYE